MPRSTKQHLGENLAPQKLSCATKPHLTFCSWSSKLGFLPKFEGQYIESSLSCFVPHIPIIFLTVRVINNFLIYQELDSFELKEIEQASKLCRLDFFVKHLSLLLFFKNVESTKKNDEQLFCSKSDWVYWMRSMMTIIMFPVLGDQSGILAERQQTRSDGWGRDDVGLASGPLKWHEGAFLRQLRLLFFPSNSATLFFAKESRSLITWFLPDCVGFIIR